MKKILFLPLFGLLFACSLKEKTDLEINPKPTLIVAYQYINNRGINTLDNEVG